MSKYVVLKQEDWDEFVDPLITTDNLFPSEYIENILVEDAVVLRKQDITVAPALHTYSSVIYSFIELMKNELSVQELNNLANIADFIHNEALSAEDWPGRRLPT